MRDTQETLNCPACNKKMEKVFIDSANCFVDICIDGCGGIFFDNREFQKFDEPHENIDKIIEKYKGDSYQKINEDKERICPSCGAKMVKHYTSTLQNIEIDECYTCGGIFLDYGELEEIRAQFKNENERSEDYNNKLKAELLIGDSINYKSKLPEDMFSKRKMCLINVIKKLF